MARKKKSDPAWIEKQAALQVLEELGPATVREYGAALAAEGFEIKGPRKPWNILHRLRNQGLAIPIQTAGSVRYSLPTASGNRPVERRAVRVLWEITPRGIERRKWLQKRSRKR